MGCRVVLHPFCAVFVFVFVLALFVGNASGAGPQKPNGPKEVHLVGPQRLGGGPDEPLPGRSPPPQPSAASTDGQKDIWRPPPPSTTNKNRQKSNERPPSAASADGQKDIWRPPPPPTTNKNRQKSNDKLPSAASTDGQKDIWRPPPSPTTNKNSQKSNERLHRLLRSRQFGPWGPPVVKSLDALSQSGKIIHSPPPPTGAKNDQNGFQRFPFPPDKPLPPGPPPPLLHG